ncbi:alpha/beta hydrolase [Leptospira selangorensis]|uniref:Alpha/beta hydrolase n=1 Tax=Leptospira selangorensis TaxID=2484982 RepID=A0A5F2C1E2_9LEPT|nr:alpha/beta fold hydrolase [Leptospira selangorensis]TGM11428.1 alpha/beta hydrolase [Leptospira selangorensis]TGM21077.1 alpha/beta hydrolase [Leptospira selangorensis]
MKRFLSFRILVLFFTLLSFWNCDYVQDRITPPDHKSVAEQIKDYIVSSYFAEQNHALYKFSTVFPDMAVGSLSPLYFQDPYFQRNNSKAKIVLIHGWDFAERQTDLPTDFNKKVANLLGTWNQGLAFITQTTDLPSGYGSTSVYDTFEIYVFTYRTSDYIEINGRRFIDSLNAAFTSSDKVVVVAHSMGGLVSRAAIQHPNNTKNVIDHIVSLGTPYYGSPYSSPQYTGNLSSIGTIIKFMTDTPGGQGLAYTNGLSAGVTAISPPITDGTNQAFNFFLESMIANTSKDSITTVYGGSMGSGNCSDTAHATTYQAACTVITNGSPVFGSSDGIVPLASALLNGRAGTQHTVSNMDHSQMSFRNEGGTGGGLTTVKTHFNNVFAEVFTIISGL